MTLVPIEEIIADIKVGKKIILVDAPERENEGDIVMAAEFITAEDINFMAKYARGLICLSLTSERCAQLNLPLMTTKNGTVHGTNFTVSIEAATGVSTGISAADRARTIQMATARDAKARDLVQPGHIFPLKAVPGGVLVRAGHTEGGCDLAQLAGLSPAAVICEIMNEDGSMARLPELTLFAQQHDLKIGSIADLIHYRSRTESMIQSIGQRPIDTPFGPFILHVFRELNTQAIHLALATGPCTPQQETLVRVHEPLSVIDLLDMSTQTHSWSLPEAIQTVAQAQQGVVLLLHHPEDPEALLERALPHSPAALRRWDPKTFGIGAQMLKTLQVGKMRLMSSSRPLPSMAGFGLEMTGFLTPTHKT